MSLSILVVTYNCSLNRSQTIRSLCTSKVRFDGVRLCIWNNGPKEITVEAEMLEALREKGFEVTIKQTPWNAPLSWIYNYFIGKYPSDRYVILDHDSVLSDEYMQYIVEDEEAFVGMPIIKANGASRFPRVKDHFSIGPYTKRDKVRSVGSGLLISQEAIGTIKDSYGDVFDENFALYGVDTSFFSRICKLGLAEKLQSIPAIEHSLSRFEVEGKEIKEFRQIERSYDFGLMLRHYPTLGRVRKLIKQMYKSLFNKNKVLIIKALKAFIQGCHERCKQPRLDTLIE